MTKWVLNRVHWTSLLCLAAILSAQSLPVFQTGTRLVQVDVVVHSDKGSVKGLTKEDFILEDRGKVQTIAVFKVTESKAGPDAAPLPPGVTSNRVNRSGETAQTATIILFDRLNVTNALAQANARKSVLEVLASLKPTDKIGFDSLYQGVTTVQEYKESAAPLMQAAKLVDAPGTPAGLSPSDQTLLANLREALTPAQTISQVARVQITMAAFRSIARSLGGVPGRKNLIWITNTVPLTFGNGGAERRQDDEAELATYTRILSEANIALYPVDPRGAGSSFGGGGGGGRGGGGGKGGGGGGQKAGPSAVGAVSGGGTLNGTQGMQQLAADTGGKAFLNNNSIAEPLREVSQYLDATYTLGFYVKDEDLDGSKRNLEVKLVKKPSTSGAKLFYRKSYTAVGQQSPAIQKERPNVAELAAEGINASAIGLLGAAAPHPTQAGLNLVQILVTLSDLQFERQAEKWVASFDLGMVIESPNGKPSPVKVLNRTLSLTDDELKQGMASGLEIDNTVPTPSQPSMLRVVVQDKTSGAAGSLRIPVAAK